MDRIPIMDGIHINGWHYQMFSICCINRLIKVIPHQQLKPKRIGLPPFFTSFTISVFSPIAAIARIMKNLLNSFTGSKKAVLTPRLTETVVMSDAIKKKIMKKEGAVLKDI